MKLCKGQEMKKDGTKYLCRVLHAYCQCWLILTWDEPCGFSGLTQPNDGTHCWVTPAMLAPKIQKILYFYSLPEN